VEAILKGRESQGFVDLNDFCRRVDLRQVGKRALESLIKVGALDRFGSRTALLEAIERMVSVSTSHFRAKEMGQMSLFGIASGVSESIHLPETTIEISRKEILSWEKELLGLYVTDHPLSPVMDVLTQAVTHFSGQLPEAGPQERVRVAGIIIRIRHHQSKAGKPMGFVTIEDLQGSIELVIFPRVWEKVADIVEFEKIVLVTGRVDAEGVEPKVIVDTMTSEFSMLVSEGQENQEVANWKFPQAKDSAPRIEKQKGESKDSKNGQVEMAAKNTSHRVEDRETFLENLDQEEPNWDDSIPPPPELFPDDWEFPEALYSPLNSNPVSDSLNEKKAEKVLLESVDEPVKSAPGIEKKVEKDNLPGVNDNKAALPDVETTGHPADKNVANLLMPASTPTYYLSPILKDEGESDNEVRMLTVIFRSSGDKTRDVLRLHRIHGIISSYPGKDRFAFHVYERGRGYILEFPNYTTGICTEMLSRIRSLIGGDHFRVEVIKIQ
jgi:DNA polymerase-3 subunit alpha